MKILLINISFFILIATPIFAATIDTLDVYSSKMEKYIKTIVVKPDSYEVLSGFPVLYLLTANRLKIIIDCGSDDFFFQANEKLHRMLLYRGIPHDYISRPGAHNWQYWENAIKFQILFFNEFFCAK